MSIIAGACSAEPPSGVFTCAADRDCPHGQRCSTADGRCYRESAFMPLGDGGEFVVGVHGDGDAGADGFSSMVNGDSHDAALASDPFSPQQPGGTQGGGQTATDAATINSQPVGPLGGADASVNVSPSGPGNPDAATDSGTTLPIGSVDSGTLDSGILDSGTLDSGTTLLANGRACQTGNVCQSKNCVDSTCCSVTSCGPCQRCGSSGSCEAINNATDPDSCTGKSTCNASGRCVLVAGEACSSASQCQSNACVDGVCCADSACGTCSSCGQAQSLGRCAPVNGAADADSCSGTSMCTATALCATIDQRSAGTGSRAIFGNGRGGMEQAAQIITVGMTGSLVEVRIGAYCWSKSDPIVPYIESIGADGQPSGTRLATLQPLTGAPDLTSSDTAQYSFPLVTPLRVSSGQKIALVLTSPSATMVCEARVSTGDVYAGGTLLWTSTDNMPTGARYYVEAGDMSFQTLMRQ